MYKRNQMDHNGSIIWFHLYTVRVFCVLSKFTWAVVMHIDRYRRLERMLVRACVRVRAFVPNMNKYIFFPVWLTQSRPPMYRFARDTLCTVVSTCVGTVQPYSLTYRLGCQPMINLLLIYATLEIIQCWLIIPKWSLLLITITLCELAVPSLL